ncbi:BREX system P-loop protein BrxC [Pseudoalteromonas sp. LC2018020214]|uniref:BREX system P-loop protein BrxC n=1 Tax=Pseudoalteromonas sp. LC2018020214 TaxID=2799564 RepID=UPI001905B046|nr:BREX system P-loop protein BrxC [Pseudoalteromonas sp. LC2018020214]QQM66443.1 BREX system P-loop protein BrxC [Pseudoalteromonas sp. LC2018020214]
MKLSQLFAKKVDRPIEGVIKADDDVGLYLELDEYVITDEVAKRLDIFLDAYLNYAGANGVWVSGFFGSGKSHLLKMLALLLENTSIEDISPLDIFLEKRPLNEGGIFANDLKRAVAIPSKSILFNIDQKADVISKTELDALVAVFVKVFDEHCGFYGKQAYIAQFERELKDDGLLDHFTNTFESISGMSWIKGRARAKRMAADVDKAYNQVSGQSVTSILDKYREDYRLSIEDFAEQVQSYIEKQEEGFRLNFFVDEVGQYIAGNIKLMTNLQTVAESLASKCKGQAWVIVTAQEDMSKVIGEADQSNESDFTKIQARFKNRMKLTSQDVAEVIQKRLLEKKEEFIPQLTELYHQQENNFKTLFDFADGSQSYRNFKDKEHFLQSYPFIPYQFGLFQSAIQNLSTHSAFEGKHSSVGERSMLGVFQEVAIAIKDHNLGELATFDLMFEGIRTALKTANQQSILKAELQLDNKFAIRLLKALFLVKYVKEFKPTVRNLCVLMHDSFKRDIPSLKLEVEQALNLLEKETYIQRNGDLFEYLTDEEQDIEKEIKNVEIDSDVIASELEKLIYDGVLKNRKIRWVENNQDYPFSRKLDDKISGRENELAINVITSFHDHRDAFEKHKSDTLFNDELRIVLPESVRLVTDLLLYKRTEKYVAHETKATQQDSIKRILTEKGIQNVDRLNQLKVLVSKLVGTAKYFVAGAEIELSGEDGQNKMVKAFGELIKHTYPNLKMLRDITYSENDIADIIKKAGQGLLVDNTQLPEAQQEMFSFIQSNSRGGIRTTVKSLVEKFESKPNGWSYAAILCNLAYLCAGGKIEVRESTNLLDDKDLVRALRNIATHANLILDPQVEFTPSQIRGVKEFYRDYFEKVAHATEAKAIAKELQESFAEQATELDKLQSQSEQYPFLRVLTDIVTKLQEFKTKPYTWFMTELTQNEDTWFDYKEKMIDPIVKFMRGPQKSTFDKAKQVVTEQKANIEYVEGAEYQQIKDALISATIFKGSAIQQLKSDTDALENKIIEQVNLERKKAIELVKNLQDKLVGFYEYKSLGQDKKDQLLTEFTRAVDKLKQQALIAMLRDEARRFEDQIYSAQVQRLMTWSQPAPKLDPVPEPTQTSPEPQAGLFGGKTVDPSPKVQEPTLSKNKAEIKSVSAKQIRVDYPKPWLASESDVEGYLEEYKKVLLAAIKEGKHIQL